MSHAAVSECAIIGVRDSFKGNVPVGLFVLRDDALHVPPADIVAEIVRLVHDEVGPVAAFKDAAMIDALPKNRTGKTLRGIIQSVANGEPYTLPETIEDATAVDKVETALASIGYPRVHST